MTKFRTKNFSHYFSPKLLAFYIGKSGENSEKNFAAGILSLLVTIQSFGLKFLVFVIFGFRPIFTGFPQGSKFGKPGKNFSVFRLKYLGRKFLTSKTFFWMSASTNLPRLFFWSIGQFGHPDELSRFLRSGVENQGF